MPTTPIGDINGGSYLPPYTHVYYTCTHTYIVSYVNENVHTYLTVAHICAAQNSTFKLIRIKICRLFK